MMLRSIELCQPENTIELQEPLSKCSSTSGCDVSWMGGVQGDCVTYHVSHRLTMYDHMALKRLLRHALVRLLCSSRVIEVGNPFWRAWIIRLL